MKTLDVLKFFDISSVDCLSPVPAKSIYTVNCDVYCGYAKDTGKGFVRLSDTEANYIYGIDKNNRIFFQDKQQNLYVPTLIGLNEFALALCKHYVSTANHYDSVCDDKHIYECNIDDYYFEQLEQVVRCNDINCCFFDKANAVLIDNVYIPKILEDEFTFKCYFTGEKHLLKNRAYLYTNNSWHSHPSIEKDFLITYNNYESLKKFIRVYIDDNDYKCYFPESVVRAGESFGEVVIVYDEYDEPNYVLKSLITNGSCRFVTDYFDDKEYIDLDSTHAQPVWSYNNSLLGYTAKIEDVIQDALTGIFYTYNEFNCSYQENCLAEYGIYKYHGFNDYKPFAMQDENTNEYFGFEIEMEGGIEGARIVKDEEYREYFHCEHDSSIENGFELISQPMTWNFLDNESRIGGLLNALEDDGQSADNEENCGLHVHVSRTAFKDEDAITKAIAIVSGFKENLEIFARREENRYCQYTKLDDKQSIKKSDVKRCAGKYEAVNTNHRDSIEFRIFQSTLNPNILMASVELCKNIVKVANSDSKVIYFDDLMKGKYIPTYIKVYSLDKKFNDELKIEYDKEN